MILHTPPLEKFRTRETVKSFPESSSLMPRDTQTTQTGRRKRAARLGLGPLIVWDLLIHKDAINSPKSNQWVRRAADSETRSCSTKRIDPRTPGKIPGELHHADQSLIVRPSAGALQQTSTQVMHQSPSHTPSSSQQGGCAPVCVASINFLKRSPLASTFCGVCSAARCSNEGGGGCWVWILGEELGVSSVISCPDIFSGDPLPQALLG